jgi:predicted pyridoxine 5'-phosphate oxidase superfamily flavin-nucleotide-binding protein
MGVITDDMRAIVGATRLCFAATVDADGTPNLSPKSSLMVYDDDHLVFANIASPNTVRNLGRNPAIEINAIDIFLRRGYRFKGTAELMPPGTPEYDFVAEPFWADNGKQFPVHEVVKVTVTRAAPVLSPAYTYIDGLTEDDLRQAYLAKYGVRLA